MRPSDFLTALWGDTPAGYIHTWVLAGKRSSYFPYPAGGDAHVAQADAYTGVALAHRDHGPHRRTRSDQAIAIAGMWLDVDDEKLKGAFIPATEPTMWVASGHGYHAWWLFDEPWYFADRAEQHDAAVMAAQWQQLHRSRHRGLDSVGDLARLMRLPGTLNTKREPVPVRVLSHDGPRYPRARLRARAREAGPVHVELGAERAAGTMGGRRFEGATLRAGGTLDAERRDQVELMEAMIDTFIDMDVEFAAIWNHQRDKHWSLSEYDMALCNFGASCGWTDQQLADLILLHRNYYSDKSGKALRMNYLRLTITKARETAHRDELMQRIRDNHDTRRAA